MATEPLEGTLILEKLADYGLVDDFYEAVDADNLSLIISLLRKVGIDEEKINEVIESLDT
jgi:hypothetical protein